MTSQTLTMRSAAHSTDMTYITSIDITMTYSVTSIYSRERSVQFTFRLATVNLLSLLPQVNTLSIVTHCIPTGQSRSSLPVTLATGLQC